MTEFKKDHSPEKQAQLMNEALERYRQTQAYIKRMRRPQNKTSQ